MSLEEGKQYLSVVSDDGKIHLKSRGDSNFLAKQFVLGEASAGSTEVQCGTLQCDYGENILALAFDSSIVAGEVFAELAHRMPEETESDCLPEDFETVKTDPGRDD